MQLDDFRDVTLCLIGQTNALPFRVDHEIRVLAGYEEIARTERESFMKALAQTLDHQPTGEVSLPVERMTLSFSHAGEDFVVIFPELSGNIRRHTAPDMSLRQYGGTYLVFRRDTAHREPYE